MPAAAEGGRIILTPLQLPAKAPAPRLSSVPLRADGSTAVLFTPIELLERLAALVSASGSLGSGIVASSPPMWGLAVSHHARARGRPHAWKLDAAPDACFIPTRFFTLEAGC